MEIKKLMLTKLEIEKLKYFLQKKQYQEFHPKTMGKIKEIGWCKLEKYNLSKTFDSKRAEYIFNNLNFKSLKVLDIGADIGYFSFSAALSGASEVISIEGEEESSEFIKLQLKLLGMEGIVKVQDVQFDFDVEQNEKYDVILCLNVLHHVGRYFGDSNLTLEEAKEKLIEYLNLISYSTKYCWLQVGYNWKGDVKLPLFANGSKRELIEFVISNISNYWEVEKIAILNDKTMNYSSDDHRMDRINELGEFGNRPLFLLKSKFQ